MILEIIDLCNSILDC